MSSSRACSFFGFAVIFGDCDRINDPVAVSESPLDAMNSEFLAESVRGLRSAASLFSASMSVISPGTICSSSIWIPLVSFMPLLVADTGADADADADADAVVLSVGIALLDDSRCAFCEVAGEPLDFEVKIIPEPLPDAIGESGAARRAIMDSCNSKGSTSSSSSSKYFSPKRCAGIDGGAEGAGAGSITGFGLFDISPESIIFSEST
jgi:hypothetical protein